MPVVLICAPDPLSDALHDTILWRQDIERHVASRFEDALTIAVAARPHLVVVDRDLPRALRLVENLRHDPATRGVSIVVAARGDFEPAELGFLQAGANAILRLPAGPDWDDRLSQLMQVSARRATRVPVQLQLEDPSASGVETWWGTVLNLSTSGMLVEVSFPLSMGTDLDFAIRLTPEAPPVRGCAHVVRQAGPGRFGVRFYGLEGDGAERVERFVRG